MEKVYYEVGQHVYCVQGCDGVDVIALLPSSEPFRLQNVPATHQPLLFDMVVDINNVSVEVGWEI
ncbi:MAG: hypothetical protein K2H92_00515, partial [Bacteroidaceae bacterium]|nr:hypothetical protein [Bacteroidaceae bacterium]